MNNGAASIRDLEAAFADCGYTFRHFPDAHIAALRWQAGRIVVEVAELPDGKAVELEHYQLLAWAPTSGALIDQLGRLPPAAASLDANGAGAQWPFD